MACAEAAFKRNLGATHHDTGANVIDEGGELGANQILGFDPVPIVSY